nr:hypothetical protein [uncultured Hyphomonas sp.]
MTGFRMVRPEPWATKMSQNPFCDFKTSPETIQLAVMMYVRFLFSPRNVDDLLHERGIDICHETVRNRRSDRIRQSPQWK